MNTQRTTAPPRFEDSEALTGAFTPLPSTVYVPRTGIEKSVLRVYDFYENGRRGVRLSSIAKYKDLNWIDEQGLRVTTLEGSRRSKMSFRLLLDQCEMFGKPKNVLRQMEGTLIPITVGKAAECAAQVVQLWVKSKGGFDLQRPGQDLCLDALLEIGGSLQILLGYRPSETSYYTRLSCKISKSRSAASARHAAPTRLTEVAVAPPPAAAVPPTTVAAPPPAMQPTAGISSASFVSPARPYGAPSHYGTVLAAPASPTQPYLGLTHQYRYQPYARPYTSRQPQMGPSSVRSSYNSHGTDASFSSQNGFAGPAFEEQFRAPASGVSDPTASFSYVPQNLAYYPYGYRY